MKVEIGKTYNNNQIMEHFKCDGQSGMRKSNRTNSLVLIAKHINNLYDDKWIGNVLHYTGEGLEGDQEITRQNKTLYNSRNTDIKVYLFEVFEEGKYIYQGEVELAEDPYQTDELDVKHNMRKVWKFPIQRKDKKSPEAIEEEVIKKNEEKREKKAKKSTNKQIIERLKNVDGKPGTRKTIVQHKERNADVVEYTKRRSKGMCDLCKNEAPFKNKMQEPYLEVHHVITLAEGGPDQIYNTVALCPNCHRKMHVVKSKDDKEKLQNIIYQYLKEEGMSEFIDKWNEIFK